MSPDSLAKHAPKSAKRAAPSELATDFRILPRVDDSLPTFPQTYRLDEIVDPEAERTTTIQFEVPPASVRLLVLTEALRRAGVPIPEGMELRLEAVTCGRGMVGRLVVTEDV